MSLSAPPVILADNQFLSACLTIVVAGQKATPFKLNSFFKPRGSSKPKMRLQNCSVDK